jgi:hypothetical protein
VNEEKTMPINGSAPVDRKPAYPPAHTVAVEGVVKVTRGTRRPVEGMSNTYLCEVREGSLVVARWVEFNSKDGGVERLMV